MVVDTFQDLRIDRHGTGLDLDEVESNPHANADGFYPVYDVLEQRNHLEKESIARASYLQLSLTSLSQR